MLPSLPPLPPLPSLPPWLLPWLPSWRQAVLLLTPLVLTPLAASGTEGRCAYVILIMAVYWMTEVVPIGVTGLVPVFAFPVLGVMSTADLCPPYMKATNMLFLGGLTVAVAVEHCGLHKRIALFVILTVGHSPRRLMTGFMITTMFLSMWISNTATTAMMVPIVDAVLQELYKTRENSHSHSLDEENDLRIAPHHQSSNPITENGGVEVPMEDVKQNNKSICSKNLHEEENNLEREPVSIDAEPSVMFAPPPNEECRKLCDMCYLATAYSANLGGTGALTGTSANLIMKGVMHQFFPDTNVINFASWLMYNVPGMLLCGVLAWLWLQFFFVGFRKDNALQSDPQKDAAIQKVLLKKYRALGRISFHEIVVLVLFFTLVLLWFFLSPGFMTGWGDLVRSVFPNVKIADATPAMAIVFLLFSIPRRPKFLSHSRRNSPDNADSDLACLTWEAVHEKVPWGIVLVLGGGYAMAEAADKSGLTVVLSDQMRGLQVLPREAIVFLASFFTAGVTEAATNSAAASVLLPMLKDLSISIRVNPIYLMLPTTLCCSYAFMLPVATAPNAIVFGAANMRTITMVKAGLMMNVICLCVATLMINTLGVFMFDLQTFPDWAEVVAINETEFS